VKEIGMARYTVCVIRDFVAQHFLIGGDWGRENQLHSHHYKLEAIFAGDELDQHQYLLDIADVTQQLEALVDRYRDKTLNPLPEFEGRNPSLELFARLLAEGLSRGLAPTGAPPGCQSLTVKLWEHEQAFATCTLSYV
jgi:6-pyruvoyltetrahydropterin/6-carboxytetrahydropterin synthase